MPDGVNEVSETYESLRPRLKERTVLVKRMRGKVVGKV